MSSDPKREKVFLMRLVGRTLPSFHASGPVKRYQHNDHGIVTWWAGSLTGSFSLAADGMVEVLAEEKADIFVPIGGDGVCHGFGEPSEPVMMDSAPQHVTHYEILPNIDSLLYDAWGLIANACGGDWNAADDLSPGWRDAAEKWRDRWHETLNEKKALERDRRVAALVGNGTIGLDDMMRIIKLYTEED